MSNVFIALQANEDSRPLVDAILADHPGAVLNEQQAMVKIDVPGHMTIRRSSVEARIGRESDLQETQVNLISLSGHVDETDEEFTLSWER